MLRGNTGEDWGGIELMVRGWLDDWTDERTCGATASAHFVVAYGLWTEGGARGEDPGEQEEYAVGGAEVWWVLLS